MAFTKITNAELNSRGATTLPNVPTIGATALKQEFDAPAKQVVAPKFNNLIDELQASTASADLGATAPTGRTGTTVQGVLNSLSTDLGNVETSSHSHSNKAVIDKFNDTGTGLTYDGNPVGAVTSVNSQTGAVVLTASDVGALPSSTTIPSKTSDLTNDSNFVADASYVHTDNNYDATAKGIVDGATAAIAAKSTVSWNQIDTTGTKIAEITIDGVKTDVKATGGGGSASDTFKNIVSAGTTFVASGNNDTFKINAGSNVTITALSSPDKGISISATGGGSSTGDMLMSDYDPSGTVKSSTNGITGYVANAISGKADTSSLATVATTGDYGDLANTPTIPAAQVNSDWNAVSGVAQILNKPTIPAAQIQSDWNQADSTAKDYIKNKPSVLGHNMLPEPDASVDEDDIVDAIKTGLLEGGTNDDVPSLNTIGIWSNCDAIAILGEAQQDDDGIGVWNDDWESTTVRTGWLWSPSLYQVLEKTVEGVTQSVDDIKIEPVFNVGKSETVGLLSYRIDDDYPRTIDGVTVNGGCVAFKFTGAIKSASVVVGVSLVHQRTNVEYVTPLS